MGGGELWGTNPGGMARFLYLCSFNCLLDFSNVFERRNFSGVNSQVPVTRPVGLIHGRRAGRANAVARASTHSEDPELVAAPVLPRA